MDRFRSSLAVLILLSLPLVAETGKVEGTLTANGKKIVLKYAYARTEKDFFDKTKMMTVITVTDKPLSAEAAADDAGLMMARDKQELSGFTVSIDADKQIVSGSVFSPAFKKMKQFSGVGMQKLTLTTMTPARIAGNVSVPEPHDFFEEKYQYNATFDLPVAKPAGPPPPPVLKGTPLPAGGGDPGKAYMAYLKLMKAGDLKSFLAAVAADRAKQAMADPDFKKMFPLIQAMQPTNVKITGGSIDGTTATLLATGKSDDDSSYGTITMGKEGGAWKVAKEEWKSHHE